MKNDKNNSVYGKTVALKEPLFNVECWNFTDGSLHVLAAGSLVRIEHANDETKTTVTLVDEAGNAPGVDLVLKNGKSQRGYRFIVDNGNLANATGLNIPLKTRDVVGEMMAWEAGELDEEDTMSLFEKLNEDGLLGQLQGCYGRMARDLGVI